MKQKQKLKAQEDMIIALINNQQIIFSSHFDKRLIVFQTMNRMFCVFFNSSVWTFIELRLILWTCYHGQKKTVNFSIYFYIKESTKYGK